MRFLYLDFDTPIALDDIEKRVTVVADMTTVEMSVKSVRATRRGSHVIVAAQWKQREVDTTHKAGNIGEFENVTFDATLTIDTTPELTPMEVVALQMLLGSDMNREAFNFQRAHVIGDAPAFWQDRWNVLYSEKL